MTEIAENLQRARDRLREAASAAGRNPDGILLLAVSKTKPASAIREAYAAGQRAFGENYVQEAVSKFTELKDLALEKHFIGPLQSNKTREIAELFDWVHSVDRLKIAERLSAQRPPGLAPLNICLQVNLDGEASKSGCAPDELPQLADAVRRLPGLRLRGLMCIPRPGDAGAFTRLAKTRQDLLVSIAGLEAARFDTLSMGMSDDLEAAVAAGSTCVRLGTAIFGARDDVPN